jgi:hypothetical protein
MADFTTALVSIEQIVTRYLLKYKLSTEDYVLYVEHCADCIQDFNIYDGQFVVTQKLTMDNTLKFVDLPEDFLFFVDLVTPMHGQWWSFTEKDRIINTTTFTDAVEGRDSTQGEGQIIDQNRVTSYGAKGGWNKFKYTLDLAARRIYFDAEITDYVVLMYISSGIRASEETEVPSFMIPMIDDYMRWKSSYWLPTIMNQRDSLYMDYWRSKNKIRQRIASLSVEQWKDLIYSTSTMTPRR